MIDIQTEISALFIECGEKYFEENQKELQKIELIDTGFPCSNYTESVAKVRPSLGCRALVQRSLRMINIITREMLDWKEPVRLHSLKLLWEVVLYAEKAFTCKFMDVFPALAKVCQDEEKGVVKEAYRVAFLMGQLLSYDDWMVHALRDLKKHPNHLGVLRCFTALFSGAEIDDKRNSIAEISKLISTSEMCHSLNENYQSILLDCIEQMVIIHLSKIGANKETEEEAKEEKKEQTKEENLTENEEKYLFEILVKTIALSNAHSNEEIANRAINLYEKFCQTPVNRINLQGKYLKDVIDDIEDLDCEHSERSERIIMLYGCIKFCGFQTEYFDSMKTAIKMVLDNCTANAQIKVLSGVSMVSKRKFNDKLNIFEKKKNLPENFFF